MIRNENNNYEKQEKHTHDDKISRESSKDGNEKQNDEPIQK